MKKLALNVEELSVETFTTLSKEAWAEAAVGVLTVLQSCSCVDCITATAGRCCPP